MSYCDECRDWIKKVDGLMGMHYSVKKDGCDIAASYGHLDCLKYAHENGWYGRRNTCENAASGGYLDCLKYAHEHGHLMDKETCSEAAKNGHLDCLKYAHDNGCPWDEETCAGAEKYGHSECLKYARENGCPYPSKTYRPYLDYYSYKPVDMIKSYNSGDAVLNKDSCTNAAKYGNSYSDKTYKSLDMEELYNSYKIVLNKDSCTNAAEYGVLWELKYAHKNGYPWDEKTCASAAKGGNLDCLKYAHENGCPWDEKTCMRAASNGHLDCLKYALENGCPMDKKHEYHVYVKMSIMKYLHEKGYLLSPSNYLPAVGCGIDEVKYLHEIGVPFPRYRNTMYYAIASGNLECIEYLYKNGLKLDDNDLYRTIHLKDFDCAIFIHKCICPCKCELWCEYRCDRCWEKDCNIHNTVDAFRYLALQNESPFYKDIVDMICLYL